VSDQLKVARAALHFWEEPCISGTKGSGAVFFSGCSMHCVFCQNQEIAQGVSGKEISRERLVEIFMELQEQGANNINLVTPTHYVPHIAWALERAKCQGLRVPVVYNTSSYEKVETLQRIDPFVDIYLPDMKFYSPTLSKRYLGKENYFEVASEAIAFMANSKPLRMTDDGKMLSGCIVRHLVMPLCTSDSKALIKWFNAYLPPSSYLSLMSQYTPFGDIEGMKELSRPITAREYTAVLNTALELGLGNRLFAQERDSSGKKYIPQWDF
jgi:putative pyruvate formate lyase activating enzyme